MKKRISSPHRGKFDDTILWCRELEAALVLWIDPSKPPVTQLFELLSEADLHIHEIQHKPYGFPFTRPESEEHCTNYIQAAVDALHNEMERAIVLNAETWALTLRGLKEARRWMQQNNPPTDNPIRY
jgi:hypothetical protein